MPDTDSNFHSGDLSFNGVLFLLWFLFEGKTCATDGTGYGCVCKSAAPTNTAHPSANRHAYTRGDAVLLPSISETRLPE